uniref:Unannotated protein n=1 Tax=freshwater metagenome TaxID=449393 RepID=A0A6J6A1H3_9ZZZZ
MSGGSLSGEVLAQARITASPEGQAVLSARADGSIVQIKKRLGDTVQRGETVAILESREAATFAADRASASARATAARAAYNRERRLFEGRITARQDLEAAQAELAAADAELRRATAAAQSAGVASDGRSLAITSPISGRLTQASALLGSYVQAGAELFRVSTPGAVQIEAAVSIEDARRLSPGANAVMEIGGGQTVAATLRSITPAVDAETRSITVLLQPVTANSGLQPGQSGRVRIRTAGEGGDDRRVVPEVAIQSVEGRDVVFVRTGDGFKVTHVTVGSRSAGRAELLDGVNPGDVIAGANAFLLKAELQKNEAGHEH